MTLNNREIELLEIEARKILKEDFDKFDFKAEVDTSLTYFEAKNLMLDKLDLYRDAIKQPLGSKKELMTQVKELYRSEHIGENLGFNEIFKQGRIIGYAGNRNTGKTNSLCALIKRFRETNKTTQIYIYGFPRETINYLKQFSVKEIDSMRQLINKRDSILIIDEMQRLKFNDRRYTEIKSEFSDFVYHNNNYAILTSPSIREFNSVIGSIIEGWLLKSVDIEQTVNGSQLKQAVDEYKGEYKTLGCIEMPKSEILLINADEGKIIHTDYIKECDVKRNQKDLFNVEKKDNKLSEKMSK